MKHECIILIKNIEIQQQEQKIQTTNIEIRIQPRTVFQPINYTNKSAQGEDIKPLSSKTNAA